MSDIIYLLNARPEPFDAKKPWKSAIAYYGSADLKTLNTGQPPANDPKKFEFAWVTKEPALVTKELALDWEGWMYEASFASGKKVRFVIDPKLKQKEYKDKVKENELVGFAAPVIDPPRPELRPAIFAESLKDRSEARPIYKGDNGNKDHVIFTRDGFDFLRVYYATPAPPPTTELVTRIPDRVRDGRFWLSLVSSRRVNENPGNAPDAQPGDAVGRVLDGSSSEPLEAADDPVDIPTEPPNDQGPADEEGEPDDHRLFD